MEIHYPQFNHVFNELRHSHLFHKIAKMEAEPPHDYSFLRGLVLSGHDVNVGLKIIRRVLRA